MSAVSAARACKAFCIRKRCGLKVRLLTPLLRRPRSKTSASQSQLPSRSQPKTLQFDEEASCNTDATFRSFRTNLFRNRPRAS
jgi:hypothetical protein